MNYTKNDLVRIARRENNNKRSYLVVDPLQGKHVPVSPTVALQLFQSLAETFKNEYDPRKILLVGFAETATAIGAQAAITVGARYMQTTREIIPGVEYLFFSEEHSHATEQKLVKNDIDAIISEIETIVFVEDEVTTGKTILNIISVLQKQYPDKKLSFAVASLLNGMTEEHLTKYKEQRIALFYLVKTDHSAYGETAEKFSTDGAYYPHNEETMTEYEEFKFSGGINARRLVDSHEYLGKCELLWKQLFSHTDIIRNEKILVLGTEECMFPALYIGKKFQEEGNTVFSHSTTRSPIAVSRESEYPLHERYELRSLYDDERRTFLYNLKDYDRIYVITDAEKSNTAGTNTLIHAVSSFSKNITLVRWEA